jgi:hypothetical protein
VRQQAERKVVLELREAVAEQALAESKSRESQLVHGSSDAEKKLARFKDEEKYFCQEKRALA